MKNEDHQNSQVIDSMEDGGDGGACQELSITEAEDGDCDDNAVTEAESGFCGDPCGDPNRA